MTELIEVRVPDIGDFKEVPVVQVLVTVGDIIQKEDRLVTLESEKATVEVPSPVAGRVRDIKATVGERVSEGAWIMMVE